MTAAGQSRGVMEGMKAEKAKWREKKEKKVPWWWIKVTLWRSDHSLGWKNGTCWPLTSHLQDTFVLLPQKLMNQVVQSHFLGSVETLLSAAILWRVTKRTIIKLDYPHLKKLTSDLCENKLNYLCCVFPTSDLLWLCEKLSKGGSSMMFLEVESLCDLDTRDIHL